MKAYTDISQSKKLAEFLPIESADMGYIPSAEDDDGNTLYTADFKSEFIFDEDSCIHCWSLATLINVIPQEIFDGEYVINITEGCDNRWVLTYDHCENRHHSYFGLFTGADNLLDACVEMILKLHEQKLL